MKPPRHWTKYLPHLSFSLSVPFIDIKTNWLMQSYDRHCFEICQIYIKVWKWSFHFDLYKALR